MELSMTALAIMTLYALLFGVLTGILYDAIRIIRVMCGVSSLGFAGKGAEFLYSRKYPFVGVIKRNNGKLKSGVQNILICITDMIFCITVGVMFCVFIYYANNGIFRLNALLGAAIGFAIYHLTVGKIVMSVSETVDAVIKIIIKISIFAIAFPFRFVYNIFVKLYVVSLGRIFSLLSLKLRHQKTKIILTKFQKIISEDFEIN